MIATAEQPQIRLVWPSTGAEIDLASIPEYWIVNPIDATITVLALDGAAYTEHGVFGRGERADSRLIEGFGVDVGEVVGDVSVR